MVLLAGALRLQAQRRLALQPPSLPLVWSRALGLLQLPLRCLCCAFLLHLLHPFDRALVGPRKHRFNRSQLGVQGQLAPCQVAEVQLGDVAQSQLLPDARRRLRNHRMHQRSDNAQRFGRGVQDRRQPRSRILIFFLRHRPRFVLDDVLVDRRHQPPGGLQRARELELLELRIEVRDGLLRQFGDGVISCVSSARSKDRESRRRNSA